jgi:hypothetical protein
LKNDAGNDSHSFKSDDQSPHHVDPKVSINPGKKENSLSPTSLSHAAERREKTTSPSKDQSLPGKAKYPLSVYYEFAVSRPGVRDALAYARKVRASNDDEAVDIWLAQIERQALIAEQVEVAQQVEQVAIDLEYLASFKGRLARGEKTEQWQEWEREFYRRLVLQYEQRGVA